ncbi:hypothetical protein HDF26_003052 [Pedobacter cryoconitis]|uniref:hypothetical protein n=1 Tax=Pedobacter cryoconitis TaxID=188932 RepID=UPI00161034A0|nr:hypothetical protein [Pedobacter cryoconitis]MBB6272595.1 hypothetical protein [Pedobacter cryoconitis]
MDDSKVTFIREKLEGNWDLVEKHGFYDNNIHEPFRFKFGKYLDYTKGILPKSFNVYYVKKRPGKDRDEHAFYINNSPFDKDPGILLKVIKLNNDTLTLGTPREIGDTVIMYNTFKRAK